MNKCPELVKALSDAGLAALAPAVAMDYFPDSTPQELARKTDVCEGAEPFVHSHFFSESGAFGSLTEDLEQVDDGTYEILDNTSFRIGNADTMPRTPLDRLIRSVVKRQLKRADRRKARAHIEVS